MINMMLFNPENPVILSIYRACFSAARAYISMFNMMLFNPENPGYMRPRSGKSWQFIGKEFFTSPVRPYVDPDPDSDPDSDSDPDPDPDPDLDETLKP